MHASMLLQTFARSQHRQNNKSETDDDARYSGIQGVLGGVMHCISGLCKRSIFFGGVRSKYKQSNKCDDGLMCMRLSLAKILLRPLVQALVSRASALDPVSFTPNGCQVLTTVRPDDHHILDPDTSDLTILFEHVFVDILACPCAMLLHELGREIAAGLDGEDHVLKQRLSDTKVAVQLGRGGRRGGW